MGRGDRRRLDEQNTNSSIYMYRNQQCVWQTKDPQNRTLCNSPQWSLTNDWSDFHQCTKNPRIFLVKVSYCSRSSGNFTNKIFWLVTSPKKKLFHSSWFSLLCTSLKSQCIKKKKKKLGATFLFLPIQGRIVWPFFPGRYTSTVKLLENVLLQSLQAWYFSFSPTPWVL